MNPIEVFDELERRRRRDADAFRSWLVGVTKGQDGSISLEGFDVAQGGRMTMLLDFEDVADVLQVSVPTVKRLVKDGHLPAVKVARLTRIRRDDLDRYVAELEPVASARVVQHWSPLSEIETRSAG